MRQRLGIPSGLAIAGVLALGLVSESFDSRTGGRFHLLARCRDFGVIAQEVKAVFPELVGAFDDESHNP